MENNQINKLLGISAGIVTVATLVFFVSNIYRNYVETKKNLLEIKKLKKELNI